MMKQKTGLAKRRLLLFILIPSIIIVIGLIIAFTGINTFLKPAIKNAIEKIVVAGSDSLYTFSLKDYTVGPGGRTVIINNLSIHVDSNRYYKMMAAGQLPPLILSIDVDKASVTGLNAWDLWRNKKIICRTIGVENAKVSFLQQKNDNKDTITKLPAKNLYELIAPNITLIKVEKLLIKDADVIFKTAKQQSLKKESWHFEKASLVLDDILVDSLSHTDTTRAWYAANIHTTLGKFIVKPEDGLYSYSIAKTEYDFKKRSATLDSVKLLPAVSRAEFGRRMGHEADQFTIVIPSIKIEDFNAAAFLIQNFIVAGSIAISEPDISLYKDRNDGPNTSNKIGEYPHQLLLKASPNINVDIIKIGEGKLTVTQKSIKTKQEGSFIFKNINGDIKNITNKASEIEKDGWCKADLSANFMGNNPMHAMFAFDLVAANGHFIVDASLQSLEAGNINKMFRALANAEMESFSLDKLQYHIEGYDHYAKANLRLLYHDLKINVLKDEEDGQKGKKGLISLIANVLKLYNDNPQKGKEERTAIGIRDERIASKNFFGLISRTLLKCAQEIAVKGNNKELPGMGAKKAGDNNPKKKQGLLKNIFKKGQ